MILRVPLARSAAARGGTAALGLGHGVRAFRHRRHAARHRRRHRLGQRADRRGQARRQPRHRALPADLRRRVRPGRARTISEVVGHFTVRRAGGELVGAMEPSRRTFPARNMATTEAALMTRGVSQLYVSLGDPNQDGSVAVRLYFKPHVLLIWLGARDHVFRRRPVAVRSAAARRRAAAGESQAR